MNQYLLGIRRFLLLACALTATVLVSGCGGSGGDSGEVTVETGSMSKAEFVKRADGICESTRTQFTTEFSKAIRENQKLVKEGSAAQQQAFRKEVVEKFVVPIYQKTVDGISTLGAPQSYSKEVSQFLNALQHRLTEIEEDPEVISGTPYPFEKVAGIADKISLDGCVESFG
jgi:hypothetical protein